MEAVVLAAVLGLSVLTAVAAAFGALALAMYGLDVASGATTLRAGHHPAHAVSESWLTEVSLHDRPAPAPRLAA
jgi:hypothetical protein